MTECNSLRVRATEKGTTLLDFLSRRLSLSRKKAKALLDTRSVFVNGRRTWMARHELRAGDEVVLPPTAQSGRQAFSKRMIFFEDADYYIINKPPGLKTNGAHSLESKLAAFLAPNEDCAQGRTPKAAHRLDSDTSGCVIFARNEEARRLIVQLFASRNIHKTYRAIVKGRLAEKELLFTSPIGGKQAVTRAKVLDSNKQASHLIAVIETGRTHQIRKHFASIRHPILGDSSYGDGRSASKQEMLVPRQMLHAFRLSFAHPVTARRIFCEAPVPEDFMRCLREFGLK